MKKTGFFISVIIIGLIIGFVFLIRGCLSTHDKYAVQGNIQLFQQPSANIVVYIRNHYDVEYYSHEGGLTNIGGDYYYYLETRDAQSLKLLKRTRLEGENVETPSVAGKTASTLWIFDKQIKAFDPFTHTIVCNAEMLTQRNPALRNNLPDESKYYTFDYANNRLEIFTKNATRYAIGEDFTATPIENEDSDEELPAITQLKAKIKESEAIRKSNNSLIPYDSIREMQKRLNVLEDGYNNQKEYRKRLNEMQSQYFASIDRLIVNAAIMDSVVYGLIPSHEMDTTNTSFSIQQYFYTEEQRYVCKAPIKQIGKNMGLYNWVSIGKWTMLTPTQYFIKGNFILSKETLEPIVLQNPKSWLVVSVKEIGQNSALLIHRVDTTGKILWKKELPVTNFNDLAYVSGQTLILCSKAGLNTDKQSDQLVSIDVQTGKYQVTDLK